MSLPVILHAAAQVSTGAVDDIRRASSLAYQTVSEYGLCAAVGPLSISALSAGGADEAPLFGRDTGAGFLTTLLPFRGLSLWAVRSARLESMSACAMTSAVLGCR